MLLPPQPAMAPAGRPALAGTALDWLAHTPGLLAVCVCASGAASQEVRLFLLLHLKLCLHQVLIAKQLLHVDKAELRQVADDQVST